MQLFSLENGMGGTSAVTFLLGTMFSLSWSTVISVAVSHLPAEAPIAPMRTAGIAITRHPNEAARDRPLALAAVLHDSTR